MDSLAAGDLLSQRFEVVAPFLVCRFSTLYRARDRKTGRLCIIRLLRLPPVGDAQRRADMRTQIEREGQALAKLSHRNLPAMLEVGYDDARTYLVLENFDGWTLDAYVKESDAIPTWSFGLFLAQMCDVLTYLHELEPPIIHRDLRPHSVVVNDEGVVKLAEFGLARIQEPNDPNPKQTLFRSEGSSNYAPPEQLMNTPSSPANDIYALGCIAYFLLTKEHPPKSLALAMGEGRLRDLSASRSDIPPALERIVRKMMEPALTRRYASLAELRDDLRAEFPKGIP